MAIDKTDMLKAGRNKLLIVGLLVGGMAGLLFILPTAAQNIGEIMEEIERVPETTPATIATQPASIGDGETESDVTVADVEEAGFTGAEAIPEQEGKYQRPVYYFRVDETVFEDQPAWGEAANLVAVTLYEVQNKSLLSTAPRALQYNEIYGRFQARFTKSGRYVVVTGPDEQKVANLAKVIEAKEFED